MANPSEELFQLAADVRRRAYAPYSQYCVGAALRGANGQIYAGCNVENVTYGLTVCAERVALVAAIADGERHFTELLVLTADAAPPCGACLQVLAEFSSDLPILLANEQGIVRRTSLRELLPAVFRPILSAQSARR